MKNLIILFFILIMSTFKSFANDTVCYIEKHMTVFNPEGQEYQKEKISTKQYKLNSKEDCIKKATIQAKSLVNSLTGNVTYFGFQTGNTVEVYPSITWKYGSYTFLGLSFNGLKGSLNNIGADGYKEGDCRFFQDGAKWTLQDKCIQEKRVVIKKPEVIYKTKTVIKKVYLTNKESKLKPVQEGDAMTIEKINSIIAQINILQNKNKELTKTLKNLK